MHNIQTICYLILIKHFKKKKKKRPSHLNCDRFSKFQASTCFGKTDHGFKLTRGNGSTISTAVPEPEIKVKLPKK